MTRRGSGGLLRGEKKVKSGKWTCMPRSTMTMLSGSLEL